MQTLCAFLNGIGGTVIFGIWPDGAAGSPPYGGEP
jgi:predicted HTH transcriptional regulator